MAGSTVNCSFSIDHQKMRKVTAFLLLGLAASAIGTASDHGYSGPPLIADYDGPVLIDNSQYHYGAQDHLSFSTAEFLAAGYSELVPLRAAIDTWAARLAIHPRVLTAVVHDFFAGVPVFGDRDDMQAVVQIAGALALVFEQQSPHPLAATRAAKATAKALNFELRPPAVLAERRSGLAVPQGGPPLFGYFQPPWEIGDTWSGGGAHGSSHNSLDFWGDWVPWGGDTTPFWVTAMQEGVARVWSSCSVSVVHPNDWVTSYYHLDHVQVADFDDVQRNDRLSNYADNEAQAICDGGFSTGPHVHMSIRYNGTAVSVDEVNVDFTAFSHHAGQGDYDTDCDRSWYTHFTAGTVCPNWDQLLNNAPGPEPIFADDFETGGTSGWSSVLQ